MGCLLCKQTIDVLPIDTARPEDSLFRQYDPLNEYDLSSGVGTHFIYFVQKYISLIGRSKTIFFCEHLREVINIEDYVSIPDFIYIFESIKTHLLRLLYTKSRKIRRLRGTDKYIDSIFLEKIKVLTAMTEFSSIAIIQLNRNYSSSSSIDNLQKICSAERFHTLVSNTRQGLIERRRDYMISRKDISHLKILDRDTKLPSSVITTHIHKFLDYNPSLYGL